MRDVSASVATLFGAVDTSWVVLAALGICVVAGWVVFRRSHQKELRPDVGAVSAQWIVQHTVTNRDARTQ
jgi:hypothetical protein